MQLQRDGRGGQNDKGNAAGDGDERFYWLMTDAGPPVFRTQKEVFFNDLAAHEVAVAN